MQTWRVIRALVMVAWFLNHWQASAQLDPTTRNLIQLGYNQPLRGSAPMAGYAFYYWNKPGFLRTNLTMRVAIAPVYLDAELGIREALGANTDVGIGVAGGGFAETYSEMRNGNYIHEESFTGHEIDGSLSVYHLFNPAQQIPLYGLLRASVHRAFYGRDNATAPGFKIPTDRDTLVTRAGLRWGGNEPVLVPNAGLELSVWHEGYFRDHGQNYGYNQDRRIEANSHRFWGRALLANTFDDGLHFNVHVTVGTCLNPDRFSAYRLGSYLPFTSEFPLSIPGYNFQELSARNFANLGAMVMVPLCESRRWSVLGSVDSAVIDYAPGQAQNGHWNSGVGGGLAYESASHGFQVIVSYGYGINAIRHGQHGGHSVCVLAQWDLEKARPALLDPANNPLRSRFLNNFLQRMF
ncbi:MAG: hypothetical protein WCO56_03515 [Verrucomicrobiota bacterium]